MRNTPSCALKDWRCHQIDQVWDEKTYRIRALLNDSPLVLVIAVHHEDEVRTRENIEVMGDQDPRLVGEWTVQDTLVKEMMSDMSINGRKGIVEEDNLALVVVGRSCKTDALSLTT